MSDVWCTNIFSHSIGYIFDLMIVSFTVCKWDDNYIENPIESSKALIEMVNYYSKVVVYKFNMQKPVAFLYVDDELEEGEKKKIIPFTIASKINRN